MITNFSKGKLFQAPVPSARCCMGCFSTGELWPSPVVVPRVFSAVYVLIFHVDCFTVWCAVPYATPCYRVRGSFHLQCNKSMRLDWQKVDSL